MAKIDLRPTLVRKGGAMLSVLVEDFVAAGAEVVTSLDHRVALPLEGAEVELVEKGVDFLPLFDRLARGAGGVGGRSRVRPPLGDLVPTAPRAGGALVGLLAGGGGLGGR